MVSGFLSTFALALFSLLLLGFGKKKGFFTYKLEIGWSSAIRIRHLFSVFAIYFAISLFGGFLFVPFLKLFLPRFSIAYSAWLIFLASSSILFCLWLYWKTLPVDLKRTIWRSSLANQPYADDIKKAFFAFCLSFPLVLTISQILEWFTFVIFQPKTLPDQLAVHFLKKAFQEPVSCFLAIFSIVVLAPFIEETLFRGFLQTFIRKHLGSKQAIFITAILFAFFHYSPEQKLGNIPIIGSLFSLALFLGFLYEKQKSLFSSISLHAMFNGFSVLNLYFLGDIPRGAL